MDRTALIDVVAGHLSSSATHEVIVDQKRRDKYAAKSHLFADEAELVLRRKGSRAVKGHKPHIHVIGAMAGTHAALLARGFEVTAADMSPDVIGQNLGGVTICDGTQNRQADRNRRSRHYDGHDISEPHVAQPPGSSQGEQHVDNDMGGHGKEFGTLLHEARHRLCHFRSSAILIAAGPRNDWSLASRKLEGFQEVALRACAPMLRRASVVRRKRTLHGH